MVQGISLSASDFLWELKFNNEKPWFLAHKDEFERLVNQPMKALLRETVALMNERWPETEFQGHVSRIYRDARRTFGRGPYKDHLWISIHAADVGRHGPGFWFELGPGRYSYGMGWYEVTPGMMEQFRQSIAAQPARFAALAEGIARHSRFRYYGEEYRRPKGDYGEAVNRWYNRKEIGCGVERDLDTAGLSAELPALLRDEFALLMPMYDYLREFYHRVGDPTEEQF